jgi:hypothetical protein
VKEKRDVAFVVTSFFIDSLKFLWLKPSKTKSFGHVISLFSGLFVIVKRLEKTNYPIPWLKPWAIFLLGAKALLQQFTGL